VTILAIDEASLRRVGQWPWPRDRVAEIVERVVDRHGARLLALDVAFVERDRSDVAALQAALDRVPAQGDGALRRELQALLARLDRDTVLARALQGRPVVLGYAFTLQPSLRQGSLPEPWLPAPMLVELGLAPPELAGYVANLPQLAEAAGRAGHINALRDLDGVTRRMAMLVQHEGMVYTSLTLAALSALAGEQAPIEFGRGDAGGRGLQSALRIGPYELPVDAAGGVRLPFYGPPGTLSQVSVADLLDGRADPALLRGRVVLMGATAAGLRDSVPTPVATDHPGVELHAAMLEGALGGRLPSRHPQTTALELALLTGCALVMLAGSRRLRLPLFAGISAALAAATVLLAWGSWSASRLWLPIATPLLFVGLLFVTLTVLGYLLETRGRRSLNRLFGQYVPPELVEEMNADPARYSMSGRSAELSVMFADVRGFTTLSEQMQPQALGELMNTLLTELSRVIRAEHRGTIDKYIGDCVMAFWGAPVPRPDHAAAAVAAALDMQRALAVLVPRLTLPGDAQLAVGIGLNTGAAVVGNMGSAYRMAYTVLGDTVNTASRLEGLTKTYGVGIVAGEAVRQAAGDEFVWRELDRVRVKGRETPLSIHEPIERAQEASPVQRDRAQRHEAALAAWRMGRFEESLRAWQALQAEEPCVLHTLWIDRAQRLRQEPPGPGWDGVYTFETK
jgi:adenylate cyclase